MSCYNACNWLEESIDSVLQQTFCDFEFVIVDDGSTDDSLAILQRYAERDKRIVILRKKNTGLADSLNVGLRGARGEWVARMDADDVCEPHRLELQLAHVREHPDCVFVGTGLILIDEFSAAGATFEYPVAHAGLVEHLVTAQRFPPHASAFYRRDAVNFLGGYRGRVRRAEDWDLWLRLSELGKLASIPQPLVRIRKHSGQISLTSGGRDQLIDCRVAIVSYLLRQAGRPDPVGGSTRAFDEFRRWVERRMSSEGHFEFHAWKAKVRDIGSLNNLARVVALLSTFILHPLHTIRLVLERFAGDSFAQRAVSAWRPVERA
jgi:glycosyltransferase involved in cell wall biosynthesis